MTQGKFPAVFVRGGTGKAIMFHARDLPVMRAEWDAIFLSAMGSPEPNGRPRAARPTAPRGACSTATCTRDRRRTAPPA
jgi:hypothetical protein